MRKSFRNPEIVHGKRELLLSVSKTQRAGQEADSLITARTPGSPRRPQTLVSGWDNVYFWFITSLQAAPFPLLLFASTV